VVVGRSAGAGPRCSSNPGRRPSGSTGVDTGRLISPHYVRPPMNLLGWIRAPAESLAHWDEHIALAAEIRADRLTRTLVCGMGGSSLVADVFAETFGGGGGGGGGWGGVGELDSVGSKHPGGLRAAGRPSNLAHPGLAISANS